MSKKEAPKQLPLFTLFSSKASIDWYKNKLFTHLSEELGIKPKANKQIEIFAKHLGFQNQHLAKKAYDKLPQLSSLEEVFSEVLYQKINGEAESDWPKSRFINHYKNFADDVLHTKLDDLSSISKATALLDSIFESGEIEQYRTRWSPLELTQAFDRTARSKANPIKEVKVFDYQESELLKPLDLKLKAGIGKLNSENLSFTGVSSRNGSVRHLEMEVKHQSDYVSKLKMINVASIDEYEHILIICPAMLTIHWADTVSRFTGELVSVIDSSRDINLNLDTKFTIIREHLFKKLKISESTKSLVIQDYHPRFKLNSKTQQDIFANMEQFSVSYIYMHNATAHFGSALPTLEFGTKAPLGLLTDYVRAGVFNGFELTQLSDHNT
ncbi:hypothetical protein VCHA53O466_50191 [Vibrio chagasii]|nr:hypothetical protein VCHA53O466_50191 [Vibrio chagasii]